MVSEAEFKEAVTLIMAANLVRVKNVVERMFQENVELKEKLKEKLKEMGEANAKPSTNTKSK